MERARKEELGQKEWNNKLKCWRAAFIGGRAEAVSLQMAEIRDPLAVKVLSNFLKDDNDREFRLLCADALARIGGMVLEGLVVASLADRDEEVRVHCLEQLHAAHFKPAVVRYIQALKDKENETVNLAGVGLFYMKDPTAIPALIDALVTNHKQVLQPGSQPGQMSTAFGSGAGGAGSGNFSFGQQQPQVVSAIIKTRKFCGVVMLSGVNFEYDVQAWKNWYTSQRKLTTFDTCAATIFGSSQCSSRPLTKPDGPQSQRVADNRDRTEAHRQGGLRTQQQAEDGIKHPRRQRDAQRIVDEGERQILADIVHRGAAESPCPGDTREVAFHQRHARAFHRDVGAGSHSDADIGFGQRRRVVNAVARHRNDMALRFWPSYHLVLILRRNSGLELGDSQPPRTASAVARCRR